jgi:S1-C subfamily serine protease
VRRLAAAAALAVARGGAGWSLSDDDSGKSSAAGGGGEPTVSTTRVQVVEDLGKKGGFDPAEIYKRLSPGVVTIVSRFGANPNPLEGDAGLGSGFVLDGGGYIATNAHVVTTGEGRRIERARQVFVEFADGNRVPARVVGQDPNSDVGLIKVDPGGLSLTPLELGSSAKLAVGSPVAAIGSPFGERQSLSVGVISAIDRDIESLTDFAIGNAIQTDAAINRGNSGGPLLNSRGDVIGINSQIKSSSGGGEGVGFAVPVDTVRRSLDQLRRRGKVDYAFLGVTSQALYPQLAAHLDIDADTGALVVKVENGSPADDAGLSSGSGKTDFQGQDDIPRGGDAIVRVDGKPLKDSSDLADLISLKDPGQRVRLDVVRGGRRRTVSVTLARRPAEIPNR